MRARVTKKDIFPAVMRAVSIADKKSVVPILSHLLLAFGKDGLTIKATDLEISVIDRVVADVDTFGVVAIPAGTFGDIIRKIPDAATLEFSISDNGNKMQMTTGNSRFELSTLDASDFPSIDLLDEEKSFRIKSTDFNKIITLTKFSMSPEENRHNLNGIYFHTENGKLVAASTDGHRLSVSQVNMPGESVIPGVIVSKKSILEIKKLLDACDKEISVVFNNNQVQLSCDSVIFLSKLVDGVFPEYKRVIPEKSENFFTVKRDDFIGIVDRVAVISDDKVRSVKLELSGNCLSCYVANNRLGSGKDEVEVVHEGQDWNAGFNAGYLLEVAQAVNGSELKVFVKDALSPILMEDESDPDSIFVVMPMRI